MAGSASSGLNGGDIDGLRLAPAPADLAELVHGFWQITRSPKQERQGGLGAVYLPTPTFEIVCLGDDSLVADGSALRGPAAFVAPPHLRPKPFTSPRPVVLWGARLAPHAIAALGYCRADIAQRYPLLAPLLNEEGASMLATALAAKTFETRCLALGALLRAGARVSRGRPASAHELRQLRALGQPAPAEARARQRAYARWIGVSPTDLRVLARFDEALRELFARPKETADLAQLAQAVGYADQAHLTRHFRRFVDDSPASFRRRMCAYLAARAAAAPAG